MIPTLIRKINLPTHVLYHHEHYYKAEYQRNVHEYIHMYIPV